MVSAVRVSATGAGGGGGEGARLLQPPPQVPDIRPLGAVQPVQLVLVQVQGAAGVDRFIQLGVIQLML